MISYFNSTTITFEFVVKYLIELLAWINLSDSELEEIVKHSIAKNDLDQLVSTLWKIGPKRRSQITSLVLQCCGSLNRTDMIDCLLDQKLINPYIWKDRYEWSPLHKAVYKRDLALVQLLISRGVDIYSREINGNTPLHIAIQSVRNPPSGLNNDQSKSTLLEIIGLLLKADHDQCKSNHYNDNGKPCKLVNEYNNFGKTALHYCVDLDPSPLTIQLIYMLIDGGANIDLIDSKGRTPFFHLTQELKQNLTRNLHSPEKTNTDNLLHSPFITILLEHNCDSLNYLTIIGKVSPLKNLCRQLIQDHFNSTNFNCLHGLLPNELINYLNRLLVK